MRVNDDIKNLLKQVADHFDLEDKAVRERQLNVWRQLKLYWNSFSNIYYSEVAHDWRIYDPAQDDGQYGDMGYYDKPVNVFRAYLESIIAALSVTVPAVTCFPDDATNPEDLDTAKAGDRIAQLIYRHNDVTQLWIHGLYIFCTEGLVACYNYEDKKEEYGTYEKETYKDEIQERYICPQCKEELEEALLNQVPPEAIIEQSEQIKILEEDAYDPGNEDAALQDLVINHPQIILCPHCAMQLDLSLQKTTFVVPKLVGVTKEPKSRMCLEVLGGLNVKVPTYARAQKEIPYLRYSYETHYANVIEMYPHLVDVANCDEGKLVGVEDPYEAWARLNPQYNGEYPINTTTVNNYWFRPAAFNILQEEHVKKLKKLFPNGCKYVKINEYFAEVCNQNLDDHWTLTYNPLSDYLVHQPLGLLLVSIQDITNELISLILQTIEHGIPQGFADPSVLNFDQYRQTEVAPGMIFPATARTGRTLNDFFHEIKSSTLSQEVIPFANMIQQLGQLVSGALPSLFGGQMEGSKTASEYSMSRSQALQRLQTPWKMLTIWWKGIFGKVIPMYMKCIVEDEKTVEKDAQGNFINTWVRKSEMLGKIGRVELEATESLPTTWLQEKDVVMQLLQAGNPEMMAMLMAPENIPYLKKAIGLTQFEIPGEADRLRQFEEIQELLNSEPMELPPPPEIMLQAMQTGQVAPPQEEPSVPIEPDIDNHQIHSEICRFWLTSDAGNLAKKENPKGRQNVILHKRQHDMQIQMQMMQQAMQEQQQSPEAGKAGKKEQKPENASGMAKDRQEDTDGNRVTIQ